MKLEFLLRDYLAQDLSALESGLKLIEKEHVFPGGRIDILARKGRKRVAIELKAKSYDTRRVCVQLLNYLNYMGSNGLVYFVAPKVRIGVYSTLQQYYHSRNLHFYEVESEGYKLSFSRASPRDLDDSRPVPKLSILRNKRPLADFLGSVIMAKLRSPEKTPLACVLEGLAKYKS